MVGLDGLDAHVEAKGNLFCGQPSGQQLKNLPLAGSQLRPSTPFDLAVIRSEYLRGRTSLFAFLLYPDGNYDSHVLNVGGWIGPMARIVWDASVLKPVR